VKFHAIDLWWADVQLHRRSNESTSHKLWASWQEDTLSARIQFWQPPNHTLHASKAKICLLEALNMKLDLFVYFLYFLLFLYKFILFLVFLLSKRIDKGLPCAMSTSHQPRRSTGS